MSDLRYLLYLSFIVACSGPSRVELKDLTLVHQYMLDGKGTAYRVVIGGDVAYVSDQAGFRSFRLTDTDATPLATYIFEPQTAQSDQPLALRGNILAVAHGARISLVDVADAANPKTLSTIIAGSSGTAWALAFDGDYLYWGGDNLRRALIADPSNPGEPELMAAQQYDAIVIRDGYIYASGPGTFTVFQEPAFVGSVAVPVAMASLPMATSLVLNGNALYGACDGLGNAFVVDVADPKAPKVVVDAPGATGLGAQLSLQDDQLLAPAYNGIMYDYDVSDPLHPKEVAGVPVARGFDGFPNHGIGRRGDLVLVGNDKGLLVLYPTLRE